MQLVRIPTRNFTATETMRSVTAIVFHGINATESALNNWVTAAESEFSLHYFLPTPNLTIQYVEEVAIAWHSGDTPLHGNINPNSIGIGISSKAWNSIQIEDTSTWLAEICERWNLLPSAETIKRHQDYDPLSSTALPVTAAEFAKLIQTTHDKYMEMQQLRARVTELEQEVTKLQAQPQTALSPGPEASNLSTKNLDKHGFGELITALVTKIFARR